jgi:hypothetical protein
MLDEPSSFAWSSAVSARATSGRAIRSSHSATSSAARAVAFGERSAFSAYSSADSTRPRSSSSIARNVSASTRFGSCWSAVRTGSR